MAATNLTPATAFPHEDDPSFAELLFRYVTERRAADEDAICRRCLPLVRAKARDVLRRLNGLAHFDDLVSAGNHALFLCVRQLTPPLRAPFRHYVFLNAQGMMYREVRGMTWGQKRKERKRDLIVAVYRWGLSQELGHEPTDAQLEERLRRDYPHHYEDLRPIREVTNPRGQVRALRTGGRPAPFRLHAPVMVGERDAEAEAWDRADPKQPDPADVAASADAVDVAARGLAAADEILLRFVASNGNASMAARLTLGLAKTAARNRWLNLRARLRDTPAMIELLEAVAA